MRFDMHCHTKEGSLDGKATLPQYIQILKNKGYQGMLITDHNSHRAYAFYKQLCKCAKPIAKEHTHPFPKDLLENFVVLKGIEYDTIDAGHILVIMPSKVNLPILECRGLKVKNLIKIVHAYGGILGPAHPCGERFLSFCKSLLYHRDRSILKSFDFMETFNACESEKSNLNAAKLAKLFSLCPLGGSDSHKPDGVGFGFTDFSVAIHNENDLIRAIKNKKVVNASGSYYHGTLKDHLGIFNYLLVYGFWPYNKFAGFMRSLRRRKHLNQLGANQIFLRKHL